MSASYLRVLPSDFRESARFAIRGISLAGLLTLAACAAPSSAGLSSSGKECVILLHGLGRSRWSMWRMERSLADHGYRTVNVGYPSTDATIRDLVETHVAPAVDRCRNDFPGRIHFVTHSMGGILVRQYLQDHGLPPGSRAVMLSPPNHGSELADRLKEFWGYRWIMGPAGQELGTGPESVPNSLEPTGVEIGVITGDKSDNPIAYFTFEGPNDGRVSVESARLSEMKDFRVVHASHAFIMINTAVIEETLSFLKNGRFHDRF
jgi:triacylglycerol lipase